MDQETGAPDTSTQEEVQAETSQETSAEELAAELAKAREVAENQKRRAEKAEKALKAKEAQVAPSQETALSPKDYLALSEAKVSSEDFDEVMEFAAFKKLSVSEALKNPTLKTLLSDRAEERKTAAATQTRAAARGAKPTTGQDLLDKVRRTGELPDSDDGMRAIAEARLAARKAASR